MFYGSSIEIGIRRRLFNLLPCLSATQVYLPPNDVCKPLFLDVPPRLGCAVKQIGSKRRHQTLRRL